jgi:hypothetical protein
MVDMVIQLGLCVGFTLLCVWLAVDRDNEADRGGGLRRLWSPLRLAGDYTRMRYMMCYPTRVCGLVASSHSRLAIGGDGGLCTEAVLIQQGDWMPPDLGGMGIWRLVRQCS